MIALPVSPSINVFLRRIMKDSPWLIIHTMKFNIALLLCLSFAINHAQSFPIDFEDPLDANTIGADGGVFNVIPDPDDPTQNVGEFTPCCQDFSNMQLSLGQNIDLSDDNNNTITFRIKPQFGTGTNGQAPGQHLLKFEQGTTGDVAYAFTTQGTDWQLITADFGPGLGNYNKLVLIPDAFQSALNDTYLVDDFSGGTNFVPPVVVLPFDFSDPDHIFQGAGSVVSMEVDPDDPTNDVMQIIVGAGPMDNAYIDLSQMVDLSDDANNTISFRMKPINGTGSNTHQFRVEAGTSNPLDLSIDFVTNGTTNWQNIAIDFPSGLGNYGRLVIIPDANNTAVDTYLIDDLMGGTNFMPPSDPEEPAPDPNTPDAEVLSIYSDTGGFTNVWTPDYSFGAYDLEADLDPSSTENFAIKMDFGVQGYGQGTDGVTDISNYNYLHLDYYTGYATQMRIILIENDGGSVNEYYYELPTNEPFNYESWTSVDLDLSFFENQGFSKEFFFQYKIGTESNLTPGIVWYDNLYFHQNVLGIGQINRDKITVSPNPTNGFWQIKSQNHLLGSIEVYDVLGKLVSSLRLHDAEAIISAEGLTAGLYFAHIRTEGGTHIQKLLKN